MGRCVCGQVTSNADGTCGLCRTEIAVARQARQRRAEKARRRGLFDLPRPADASAPPAEPAVTIQEESPMNHVVQPLQPLEPLEPLPPLEPLEPMAPIEPLEPPSPAPTVRAKPHTPIPGYTDWGKIARLPGESDDAFRKRRQAISNRRYHNKQRSGQPNGQGEAPPAPAPEGDAETVAAAVAIAATPEPAETGQCVDQVRHLLDDAHMSAACVRVWLDEPRAAGLLRRIHAGGDEAIAASIGVFMAGVRLGRTVSET